MQVWLTEQSPRRRAVMAKLSEECGELVAILSRCAAQGIDAHDPDTDKPNIEALMEEIADVRALSICVIAYLDLNKDFIDARAALKVSYKHRWLEQVPE